MRTAAKSVDVMAGKLTFSFLNSAVRDVRAERPWDNNVRYGRRDNVTTCKLDVKE
jgi:hypothetical protein